MFRTAEKDRAVNSAISRNDRPSSPLDVLHNNGQVNDG